MNFQEKQIKEKQIIMPWKPNKEKSHERRVQPDQMFTRVKWNVEYKLAMELRNVQVVIILESVGQ